VLSAAVPIKQDFVHLVPSPLPFSVPILSAILCSNWAMVHILQLRQILRCNAPFLRLDVNLVVRVVNLCRQIREEHVLSRGEWGHFLQMIFELLPLAIREYRPFQTLYVVRSRATAIYWMYVKPLKVDIKRSSLRDVNSFGQIQVRIREYRPI
jgi:hypothetical protein